METYDREDDIQALARERRSTTAEISAGVVVFVLSGLPGLFFTDWPDLWVLFVAALIGALSLILFRSLEYQVHKRHTIPLEQLRCEVSRLSSALQEAQAAVPVFVERVEAAVDEKGETGAVVSVLVANDGNERALGVELMITVDRDGSSVQEGPRRIDVGPQSTVARSIVTSFQDLQNVTVSGTVSHKGESRPYCFRYSRLPREGAGSAPQFVRCDDDQSRRIGMKAEGGGYSLDMAEATLFTRGKNPTPSGRRRRRRGAA